MPFFWNHHRTRLESRARQSLSRRDGTTWGEKKLSATQAGRRNSQKLLWNCRGASVGQNVNTDPRDSTPMHRLCTGLPPLDAHKSKRGQNGRTEVPSEEGAGRVWADATLQNFTKPIRLFCPRSRSLKLARELQQLKMKAHVTEERVNKNTLCPGRRGRRCPEPTWGLPSMRRRMEIRTSRPATLAQGFSKTEDRTQ